MASIAAAGMLAAGALFGGAGTAQAAPQASETETVAGITFDSFYYGNGRKISAYRSGEFMGDAEWIQDSPTSGGPGDRLCVFDPTKDRHHLSARLKNGRSVTTNGHNVPHRACKGGNLPEDRTYKMRLCVTGSGGTVCSRYYEVTS
ncbi:hypothetical protein ABT112_08370 [Streptomyces sp. NPDC002055]|uniref:hypothetical protein n=1 Tax=Streptomyces sp. NPDC002055 TaxID=3154534 RepID=UPI0033198B22